MKTINIEVECKGPELKVKIITDETEKSTPSEEVLAQAIIDRVSAFVDVSKQVVAALGRGPTGN